MDWIAAMVGNGVVLAAALYLMALGGGALVRPERTKRFLGGFAGSARIHFTELALRVVTGGALVLSAPRLAFSQVLTIFGWILIGSSLALALVPWRLHHRFAAWSVPRATQHMPVIGVASIAGGLFLLGAVFIREPIEAVRNPVRTEPQNGNRYRHWGIVQTWVGDTFGSLP